LSRSEYVSRKAAKNNIVHPTSTEPLLVGRIYKANAAPAGTPWMWTLLPFGYHEDRTPTQGYAGDA
jgi:hypothetical protein